MGSLNNLYISQSFQSLIHLGSDWTASANLTTLQDGLGNSIGISVNTDGDITALGDITASNLYAPTISGSNGHFSNGLFVSGTISAYELKVVIESSSIIFTSGSNIIGDEANVDTQTLIGRIINTGSLEITGSTKTIGNITVTGSLDVSNNISSSTLSGVGNVTLYSASVNNRLDSLENFSSSQYKTDSSSFDNRLDIIEIWSQSISFNYATQAELNLSSSQLQANINTKLDTASFNSWTNSVYIPFSTSVDSRLDTLEGTFSTSVDSRLDVLEATASLYVPFSSSVNSRLNTIEVRYATTGSNTFVGNQVITGSLILSSSATVELEVIGNSVFTGSVRGNVIPLTISSNTASIDCSLGNFFTLGLVGGVSTHITATNIRPGETLSLRITQPTSSFGSVTYNTSLKFPGNFPYVATPSASAIDVISMISFDSSSLLANAVNTLR